MHVNKEKVWDELEGITDSEKQSAFCIVNIKAPLTKETKTFCFYIKTTVALKGKKHQQKTPAKHGTQSCTCIYNDKKKHLES